MSVGGWGPLNACPPQAVLTGASAGDLGQQYVRVGVPTLRLPEGQGSLLLKQGSLPGAWGSLKAPWRQGRCLKHPRGQHRQDVAQGAGGIYALRMDHSSSDKGTKIFFLGGCGDGRKYSVGFVLSKEAQWYF